MAVRRVCYSTAKPVALAYSEQPIIDSLDINGDGRAHPLYQRPASIFTGTNLNGADISTGTAFGNPGTGATPIAGGSLQSAANLSIRVEI